MRICITCDGISDTTAARCAHCGTPLLETTEVHVPLRRGEGDADHPLLGTIVGGKYRLQGVLGKGGMGTVFRAVHEVSLVPVALKLLHRRFATKPEYRSWFLAEARKAGRVTHEHSARIQDVGETEDGTVFIAMELAAGQTLSEWLAADTRVATGVVVEILIQIARALEAAHAVGVVHRDLTPRNVSISVRDRVPFVKVLDFGIAKIAPAAAAGDLDSSTAAPSGFASPAFAAPEHLENHDVDARADLYSLGVIAFSLLTGRLPVRGHGGAELARATVAGEVERLRPGVGIPSRLVRLVNSLLARDPSARPASATAVVAELRRVRQAGQARGLRAAAIATAMLAVGLSVAASRGRAAPFLGSAVGSSLQLVRSSAITSIDVQSSVLDELSFEFQDLDPAALEVDLSRAGLARERLPLAPDVDGQALTLSTDQPEWRLVVDRIRARSTEGPVTLEFRVAGAPALGYASVRIDDEPPEIRFEHAGELAGGILRGDTPIHLLVEEVGEVEYRAVCVEAGERHVRVRAPDGRSTAVALLGAEFPGVRDHGPATIWAEAIDAAGNRGRSETMRLRHLDLRASEILSVPQFLTFDASGAFVRAVVDEGEEPIEVSVRGPQGASYLARNVRVLGKRIDFDLVAPGAERSFEDGRFSLRLQDRWGNVSSEFEEEWQFQPRDPGVEWFVEEGLARRRADGSILCGGTSLVLRMRCSTLYRVGEARVWRAGEEPRHVAVERVAEERYLLHVPRLSDGRAELEVTILPKSEGDALEGPVIPPISIAIMTRSELPRVRLQELRDVRFLRELVDRAVLARDGAAVVREGPAWSWDAGELSELEGVLWLGDEERVEPRTLVGPVGPGAPLLRGIALRRGWNVIALELRDFLERPLEVWLGDQLAERCEQAPGSDARTVLRFYHHDEPCSPVEPILQVEHGQRVPILVRCVLPLRESDRVTLQLGAASIEPTSIEAEGPESVLLRFGASFAQLARAAGVSAIGDDEFRQRGAFDLDAAVRTPAGEFSLRLRIAPTRSLLRPTPLSAVSGDLPPAIGSIELVPVLGSEQPLPDPVPYEIAARVAFRPLPAQSVRNVPDVFLQRSETTRAQYAAIVEHGLRLAAGLDDPQLDALVHGADPLGVVLRLTDEHMIPVGLGPERWWESLAAGPDRPVTGIDFFQAYTATRLAGLVVGGGPALFRLPMGAELEAASIGERVRDGVTFNGTRGVPSAEFEAASRRIASLDSWPPTAAEARALGDRVETEGGFELIGLDFGVREWVADLPYSRGVRDEAILLEWLSDHARHLERVDALAHPEEGSIAGELGAHCAQVGVIRGLAFGELVGLIDGSTGLPFRAAAIGPEVPGVVRCRNLRRDGMEPRGDRIDPALGVSGMRLAGAARFIARARDR